MVSEHSTPAAAEEPLLGTPPALSDDSWDQMLNSAFEAPPGYADGIVDAFEAPESADDSIDVDDHSIDFDGIAGGAGEAAANEADDSLIDIDDADAEPESDAQHGAPEEPDANSESDETFGFGIDTLMGTEDSLDSDVLEADPADGLLDADAFTIDTAELEADDLGHGLDGDYGADEHYI